MKEDKNSSIVEFIKEKKKKLQKYKREYYQKNKETIKKSLHKYYLTHKAELYKKEKYKTEELRKAVLEKYGNRCNNLNCPIPMNKLNVKALQIDHVHGNGKKDRHKKHCYIGFLREVLMDEEGNYQTLCPYCNWIKRMENHEVCRNRRI